MALLSYGTPLTWEETARMCRFVKEKGIKQFIECYEAHKDRQNDLRTFGHELEYMIVHRDDGTLWTGAAELIPALNNSLYQEINGWKKPKFLTEYGSFMIECIPGEPFPDDLSEALTLIEPAMNAHSQILKHSLPADTQCLTLAVYPFLGLSEGVRQRNNGNISDSRYHIPDELINKHPRYGTLSKNIRARRGSKVDIRVPKEFSESRDELPIHMDAMVFGMGNCCLQVTFQAPSMQEAMLLYDCLIPLTPLFMVVSAAAPIFKGEFAGWDCRWNVVAMSVDDRTEAERKTLKKSRFGSVSHYLSAEAQPFNNLECPVDQPSYEVLQAAGVPENISKHIAHLFIRDPLVIFEELLMTSDGAGSRDHFENIQSTNWQSLRFKLPPEDGSGGWRVEFRVMDIQLDDRRNAMLIAFLGIIVRSILCEPGLWKRFWLPITQVDENMERAHLKGAITKQKFQWHCGECSALEIFREIVPLMLNHIAALDSEAQRIALEAVRLVMDRAAGVKPTDAQIIRDFYKKQPKGISLESFLRFIAEK